MGKTCPHCQGRGKCERCRESGKIVGILGDIECGLGKGIGKCLV